MEMENPDQLVAWVEKWAEELKIEHLETPLHSSLKNLTDFRFFHTKMYCFQRIFRGNGSGQEPELALIKSISECIERAVSIGHCKMKDSNGKAAHFSWELAAKAARLELLERDAFFSHFLTQTPFVPAKPHKEVAQMIAALKVGNIPVNFFRMQSMDSRVFAVLCRLEILINGRKRSIISAAAEFNHGEAQLKALSEILSLTNTLLNAQINEEIPQNEIEDLLLKGTFGPWDHVRLFFSPKHVEWFEETFFASEIGEERLLTPPNVEPNIDIEKLSFIGTPFEQCGLHVAAAKSSDLQIAFWGLPQVESVNLQRLRLLKPELKLEDIPWKKFHLFG